MKVVLPGGSGQVGTVLARALHADGHEVVVLSRTPAPAPWRVVAWDAATVGPWEAELDGAYAVVNLAGRSVNCRYTAAHRADIVRSRVASTRAVGQAIARAHRPPAVWLQASTATIYAHRHDAPNDEATGIIGGSEPGAPETWRFSVEVAPGVGAHARRGGGARHAQGEAALGHDHEPGPGRNLRRAPGAGAPRPGRTLGRRAAVRLVDPPRGLRPRRLLAAGTRRRGRCGEPGRPWAAAERRVHARAPRGVGRPRRTAGDRLDAGDRRGVPAHGDGADPQEPPRGARTPPGIRLHLPAPRMAGGRTRPVRRMARDAPRETAEAATEPRLPPPPGSAQRTEPRRVQCGRASTRWASGG
jgi:hypothetical protein